MAARRRGGGVPTSGEARRHWSMSDWTFAVAESLNPESAGSLLELKNPEMQLMQRPRCVHGRGNSGPEANLQKPEKVERCKLGVPEAGRRRGSRWVPRQLMQQTPSPCTAGETLAPEQIVGKPISRNGENRKCRGRSGGGMGAKRMLRRSWKWTILLEKFG